MVPFSMKKLPSLILLLVACNFCSAGASPQMNISLVHDSEPERQTRAQLDRILRNYDASKWIFTKKISIETGAIPHSHPVLTLNSRHLKNDNLLLSTFLHEQIHWFLDSREESVAQAIGDLKLAFPNLPIGYPEGADSEESNYEHLLVIFLEYKAMRDLLGDSVARQVMDFWTTDHYKKLYSTILDNQEFVFTLASKYGLVH